MSKFTRGQQADPALSPVQAFWQWWEQAAGDIADGIEHGHVQQFVEPISDRVRAVDPGLAWELSRGQRSRHALTVTAECDPARRRIAREWLLAAPVPSEQWEYFDLRQPSDLGATIHLGGAELRLADMQVVGTPRGTGLDVVGYHPALERLPEQARLQVMFLAIDAALGEEKTELWIGSIDPSLEPPAGARPLAELPAQVAQVAEQAMPNGEMGWTLLRGQGHHGPIMVACLNRLASVQAPNFDEHVAVTVPFADRTAEGFPGPDSLPALRQFEDALVAELAVNGMLVAHETSAGVRVFHCYVDSTSTAADALGRAAAEWPQGAAAIAHEFDPAWDAVAQFRQ